MKFMRMAICLGLLALGACAAADDHLAAPSDDADLTSAVVTKATPDLARVCWVDDNGIHSCCTGSYCCSYIDGRWWCG
jgi:hypothetical protein